MCYDFCADNCILINIILDYGAVFRHSAREVFLVTSKMLGYFNWNIGCIEHVVHMIIIIIIITKYSLT
jgi:hypothetical protein